MKSLRILLLLLAAPLFADTTPYEAASLVLEQDATTLSNSLTAALTAPQPLVRATAARVIAVRNLTALVPQVREQLEKESDAVAARELVRTIGLLGSSDDLTAVVKSALRFPAGVDDALAVAVARRGVINAVPIYFSTLKDTRMDNYSEFFRVSLWSQPNAIALIGSRLVGANDEKGWRGLLRAAKDSDIAVSAGVLTASLDSEDEGIRAATIWYLVRGFAVEPDAVNAMIREKLAVKRAELSSDREDFGRVLLARMFGGERVNDPRWLTFLASNEADALLSGETAALQYLTDEEYAVRYNRCEVQSVACFLPKKRSSTVTIPSQPVAPPAFTLPELLPEGLANAILSGARCRDGWIGVARATVDSAGRVQTLDLEPVGTTPACKRALETLLRVSVANNTSVRSPLTGPVLLARGQGAAVCLDEPAPQTQSTAMYRVGGDVQAPKVKKRVEPQFPESARSAMGAGRNVIVIAEMTISRTSCVRSIRLLSQSPFGAINAAALLAISQWTFTPGYLDGKPVDVTFNITINFSVPL